MTGGTTVEYLDTVSIHNVTEAGRFNVFVRKDQIVVEGAKGEKVWLYDAVGRRIATKQEEYAPIRFTVSASGAYLVKVGNYPARRVVVVR